MQPFLALTLIIIGLLFVGTGVLVEPRGRRARLWAVGLLFFVGTLSGTFGVMLLVSDCRGGR